MKYWSVKNHQSQEDIDYKTLGLEEWEYKVLLNREVDTAEKIRRYLNPNQAHIASAIQLKDMVKAGNIIQSTKGKIRVIGDYDCDGVMSTTILVKGLKDLGYSVDYDIPHRRYDGYGLQVHMVEKADEDGIQLIITCDNGIAQFDAIKKAKELGIRIIVIDHHQVVKENGTEILPDADAIINPHQEKCHYPFKELCGGALAYYFIKYIYTISGRIEEIDSNLIGFATIATICDVMVLKGENRDLTVAGLQCLNESDHIGFRAIKEASSIHGSVSGYHIGFIIGPTINAAGRLKSAKDAVELFLTDDIDYANKVAAYLRELNTRRQELTVDGVKRLESQLLNQKEREQLIYILKDETIDESIVGIIAGKIKEKYHRPCIVITKGEHGLKGSGRSIGAYHMVDNIRKSEALLTSFGGHAMACGLSLNREKFVPFKLDVLEKCHLDSRDLIPRVRLDAILAIDQVSFDTVERLKRFEPYGNGNPRPIFGATGVFIEEYRVLGKNRNVIKLLLAYKNSHYDGILFRQADEFITFAESIKGRDGSVCVDMAYFPKIDSFNNKNTLQFQVEELRQSKRGG